MLLTALFFAVLWVSTGRVPAYGWLAVSAAAWSVVSLNYWAQNVGMTHWNWVRAFFLALGVFITTIPVWSHRLVETRRAGIERVFFAMLVLYAALALTLSDRDFATIIPAVRIALLAIAAYGVVFLIRARSLFAPWEARAYTAGGIGAISLAASDVLRAVGLIDSSSPEMFPYVGLVLVICFATTLGVRFSSALREARRLNADLEERVRVKTRQLEDRHERVRELERVQVLAGERERLVREMHDGLGGQLVATLALVKSGASRPDEVADALRNALDDMRAVIDSMDPLVDDLGKLFGGFRARFDSLQVRRLQKLWAIGVKSHKVEPMIVTQDEDDVSLGCRRAIASQYVVRAGKESNCQ